MRVVDASGALVKTCSLRLVEADISARLKLLSLSIREGEALAPFSWLQQPIDLAVHNPLRVDDLPECLHGLRLRIVATSDGLAPSETHVIELGAPDRSG